MDLGPVLHLTLSAMFVVVLAVSRELCVFHVDGKWKSTRERGKAHVDA